MIDTYGELDVWLYKAPRLQTKKPIKLKCKEIDLEKYRENARLQAKKFRAKKKAELITSMLYLHFLEEQNAKLKRKINRLKNHLEALIIKCIQK